ncbi:MAG: LysR family transcriptional regulator [Syntrophomonadaceae bacterium]|nr:LysR family transcriptional regulator [Syntrophomonadaceae bacterium]MDD4561876.1 LysR family transcriptional regulator [Syntrophomonadaceae bacterium]
MNIEQFEIFKTIAEVKSFTKAAKKLSFTQPAISTQIKILEQNFDLALFERHNHGVQLTDAGRKFYEYGDRILALYEEMEQDLARIKGHNKEVINIAACDTAGNYILPSIVINFKELHPQACLRLEVAHTQDIIEKLKQRHLDIGIIEGKLPADDKSLSSVNIYDDKLVLVVPRKNKWLKDKKSISLDKLRNEPFIAREEGSCIRNVLDAKLAKAGRSFSEFNVVAEFNNYEAIKQAVINNNGVALMPESVARRELDERLLWKVYVDELKISWNIKAVWRHNELQTGNKKQFLDYISNLTELTERQALQKNIS